MAEPLCEIKPGGRLRLSAIGKKRNPRVRAELCTVLTVGNKRNGVDCLTVRLDGNVSTTRMHRKYLEPLGVITP